MQGNFPRWRWLQGRWTWGLSPGMKSRKTSPASSATRLWTQGILQAACQMRSLRRTWSPKPSQWRLHSRRRGALTTQNRQWRRQGSSTRYSERGRSSTTTRLRQKSMNTPTRRRRHCPRRSRIGSTRGASKACRRETPSISEDRGATFSASRGTSSSTGWTRHTPTLRPTSTKTSTRFSTTVVAGLLREKSHTTETMPRPGERWSSRLICLEEFSVTASGGNTFLAR